MAKIGFKTFDIEKPTTQELVMSLASGGIFGHCEILFSDNSVGYSCMKNGVVLRSVYDNEYKGSNWLYYTILCTKDQEDKMKAFFLMNYDKGYNWTGIFGSMVGGLGITRKKGMFCSEVCFDAMVYAQIIPTFGLKGEDLSPTHLELICERQSLKFRKI